MTDSYDWLQDLGTEDIEEMQDIPAVVEDGDGVVDERRVEVCVGAAVGDGWDPDGTDADGGFGEGVVEVFPERFVEFLF